MPADTDRYEACELPNRGQLWSYTVQRFAPKSPPYAGPVPFQPFALGYVELAGALIVESRLIDIAFENLSIGVPLELVVVPFRTDPDGTVVTTFAFRPLHERES